MSASLPHSEASAAATREPPPPRRSWRWWLGKLSLPLLFFAVGIGLIAAVGAAQRWGWISAGGGGAAPAAGESDVIHTCPMHPQIRQPGPGRCPICGMELVPAASGGGNLEEFAVHIEPAQRRLANIQTAEVRREPLTASIQTIGAIAIDESRLATIASYIDGRLERLFADYTGVDVAKGDHLAVVYSPDLYAAQVEYLEARKTSAASTSSTLAAVREAQSKLAGNSRRRLVELGMTEEQLTELEQSGQAQSRITIYAPMGGTVTEKLAVEGMYVSAGEPIYRIANLSTVWLMLELFPEDAARIRFGQEVKAEVQSLPGETFEGRVAFIDPTVDKQNRTVGVRVEFLNDDRRLRPGDYAKATIFLPIGDTGNVYDSDLAGKWISPMHPQIIRDKPGQCPICGMDLVSTERYGYAQEPVAQPTSLYVPRSAVLMAGSNSVVYVETEPGRFELRPVTLGPILRDKIVVLEGLKEGEQVATAGNFLIDSQMQLAGKPSLIDPTRAVAKAKERNEPLELEHIHIVPVAGKTGVQLEEMYAAYFEVQKALAADQTPPEASATQLHQRAAALSGDAALSEESRSLLTKIATQSEHLHHLPLQEARHEAFRPVSHAMIELAAQVRGEGAGQPFTQMFCPMVKGGAGDWLQPGSLEAKDLRNPYWGSGMLTCGDVVRTLPASGHSESEPPAAKDAQAPSAPAREK